MTATTADWFRVDKKGLAQIVERRGKSWILYELLSNAWDEASTKVDVQLVPEDGKPIVTIIVTDDNPDGFKDLADAWTLFAASKKKGDAEKRGRFNLGEKLVLAMCQAATIRTTTGTVMFGPDGRRQSAKGKTERGSVFEADIRMTRTEYALMLDDAHRLIIPISTSINGTPIAPRIDFCQFQATLPTEIADAEGTIKRSLRKTVVKLYSPINETAMLYEMGIPVVELPGDPFDINVMQKVPLNMERDNVTPAYLRDLRGLVLSHAHDRLSGEQKSDSWVNDAIAAPTFDIESGALDEVIEARFGTERVAFDPSDREANDIAASKGLTVVHGGSLPGAVWDKVKAKGLILPAGQVTPAPKPFHPDGAPLKLADVDKLPAHVKVGIEVYKWVGKKLLGFEPTVIVADDRGWPFDAAYGKGTLTLNYAKLGSSHFELRPRIYELAIHEYAHHFEGNHLSEKFHEACCKLGAKLAAFFDEFGGGHSAIADDRNIDSRAVGSCGIVM